MEFQFTIIVPVYNEIESLPRLFEYLQAYLKSASLKSCVLLVDDGSGDGSASAIEKFCIDHEDFNCLLFDKNYGKGAALKAAFDYTKTPLLGYLDADLQTHPEDFELLLPFINDFGLVTGWRKNRKDTLVKRISSKTGNAVRIFFTHDNIHDTGCPLKIMHTEYAKKIPMFKGLQRFLPAMILLQQKEIKEVVINHYPRIEGKSKYNFKNRFLGPLIDCFAYVWIKKSYIDYSIKAKHE
ncbi:dolichol-phosphate mannosyltransferase [Salegentibacter salinarum]|uniref:Dolichol-phosphate mannosyltransferase n=1 Tax=Salegentibacter salinarum TaxID=447422 RepID=A0A2N0TQW2_9FLAO|nr:glycosyltransferase family 2 protein [Salegentibacter salinarum]PKD17125.1 dolichol-phosphate mannosyltransferase [Salegentibacter salinarum]SKB55277.1 Glycosyltransferase involved in cell wall bisynthesis [Salegentibacter salinarum]